MTTPCGPLAFRWSPLFDSTVPRDWAYQYLDGLAGTGKPVARRSRTMAALCLQRATVYRQSLDEMPDAMRSVPLSCDVPTEVASLIDVPSVSTWVPETHAHAYFLTVAQLCRSSEDAFLAAAYETALQVYRAETQRLLLLVVSPTMIVRGGPGVLQQMHRGSDLRVESVRDTAAYLRLAHLPLHLVPTLARMYGVVFAASLHTASAVDAEVTDGACSDNETVWRARWTRPGKAAPCASSCADGLVQ